MGNHKEMSCIDGTDVEKSRTPRSSLYTQLDGLVGKNLTRRCSCPLFILGRSRHRGSADTVHDPKMSITCPAPLTRSKVGSRFIRDARNGQSQPSCRFYVPDGVADRNDSPQIRVVDTTTMRGL